MHKYLNAIGFHDIASEREWYQILLESEKKFSGYDRIALDEHTDLCELRREYGNGIGISSCGFIDENDEEFRRECYFPYFSGSGVSSYADIAVEQKASSPTYIGVCEDVKLGCSIIFHIQNGMEYIKEATLGGLNKSSISITFSGLALSGKILLPVTKDAGAANKYLFRKSLMVEAGKFKQTSLDRLEKTYENHLKDTDAFSKTFSNLTADDITATINAKKEILSYSSLKKIYLFWSAMIKTAISLGELPKNFSDILNRVIMPEESVLPVETKEISIIPPEHEQIIKEIAMEPSPNKNERYLYRYGPAIVFLLNTGLRGGELLALGQSSIVPFLGRRGIKITHTLSRVKNREAGSKKKTKMILTPPKYPNSLRTIPLNKEAEFSLSCMMELYDKNRVFPDLILSTQNGVSPTIQNLANTLKKICKRAEIPEYNLHALRHTFATNLIRQTHNMGEIKEAAEIIGDNYEVIMRTYVHTDSERKVSLIDAMIA